jgi:hypothetical protein
VFNWFFQEPKESQTEGKRKKEKFYASLKFYFMLNQILVDFEKQFFIFLGYR